MRAENAADDRAELLERAMKEPWYHTLELAPGKWTHGWFDLRESIRHYHIPEDMTGMRVLDIGTWDGFWAFEFERRGAAEVVALDLDDERDLDWPRRLRPESYPERGRGDGFRLAKAIKGSDVERIECSIYNASADDLGQFDFVFCGSVLTHLRDQLLALEHINDLCRDTGTFVNAEVTGRIIELVPIAAGRFRAHYNKMVFWQPNTRAWKRMIYAAGFDHTEVKGRFKAKGRDQRVPHVVFHSRKRA